MLRDDGLFKMSIRGDYRRVVRFTNVDVYLPTPMWCSKGTAQQWPATTRRRCAWNEQRPCPRHTEQQAQWYLMFVYKYRRSDQAQHESFIFFQKSQDLETQEIELPCLKQTPPTTPTTRYRQVQNIMCVYEVRTFVFNCGCRDYETTVFEDGKTQHGIQPLGRRTVTHGYPCATHWK